jgi:hypothetical protein
MTAHYHASRLGAGIRATPEHCRDDIGIHSARERQQVHSRQRLAAHGVDVGKRVRGGDTAEIVWIVHHRSEEIDSEQQRAVPEAIDRGVVRRVKAHHEFLGSTGVEPVENRLEVRRTPLGRSTGFGGKLCQTHGIHA